MPAPGSSSAYMVASSSSEQPHFVRKGKGGKDHCPMWHGCKICSHLVAVAEKFNSLNTFLATLAKNNGGSNISRFRKKDK